MSNNNPYRVPAVRVSRRGIVIKKAELLAAARAGAAVVQVRRGRTLYTARLSLLWKYGSVGEQFVFLAKSWWRADILR
jgi:hypothetical protein